MAKIDRDRSELFGRLLMTQRQIMPKWFRWAGTTAFVLIAIALVVVPGSGRLYAEPAGTVTMRVDPSIQAVPANGTFSLHVKADVGTEMSPNGLGAAEADAVYEPDYLEATSATDGNWLASTNRTLGSLGPIIDQSKGTAAKGAYSYHESDPLTPGPTGNDLHLWDITFSAKRAGITEVSLSNALMTDTQANAWPNGGTNLMNTVPGKVLIYTPYAGNVDSVTGLDPTVYVPSTGEFWSRTGSGHTGWEKRAVVANTIPVLGDVDGDNMDDPGAYSPASGNFWFRTGNGHTGWAFYPVVADGIPLVGNVDNVAGLDPTVYVPSTGEFWSRIGSGHTGWEKRAVVADGIPFLGDIDGDNIDDYVVFKDDKYWARTGAGHTGWRFRPLVAGIPVLGDTDGNGEDDINVYRIQEGDWWARTGNGQTAWFRVPIVTNAMPPIGPKLW